MWFSVCVTVTSFSNWYFFSKKTQPYCHNAPTHDDDVIKLKYFPRYWPLVRGIHWSPVNFPHKGQWRGALMFSLICAWKQLSHKWRRRWVEMLTFSLWLHCNVTSKVHQSFEKTCAKNQGQVNVDTRPISPSMWGKTHDWSVGTPTCCRYHHDTNLPLNQQCDFYLFYVFECCWSQYIAFTGS